MRPLEPVILAYAAVWNETDASRQQELLKTCWTESSEIIGPGYYFKGTADVLAEISRFQRLEPGSRLVLTSGFDIHHNWARFSFALQTPDGTLANEGWDLVEVAADRHIARVISFWGKLPPIPGGVPDHLVPAQVN
jgi:hypothetical protein